MTLDFDEVVLFPIYDGDIASDATPTLARGASYSTLPDATTLRVIVVGTTRTSRDVTGRFSFWAWR